MHCDLIHRILETWVLTFNRIASNFYGHLKKKSEAKFWRIDKSSRVLQKKKKKKISLQA